MKKIILVHPGGGCGNYILLNLCGINYSKTLAYHDFGSHSGNPYLKDFRAVDKNNIKTVLGILVVRSLYNEAIKNLSQLDIDVDPIQVIIDDFQELLVLNWFMKHNNSTVQSWINTQKEHWTGEYATEKSVAHWVDKMFDKNFVDVKLIDSIQHTFSFSSLYKNYEIAKEEFKKFGINYNEKKHMSFLESQSTILNRWNKIKEFSIENPLELDTFYERGIAMSLHKKLNNFDNETLYKKLKI